MKNKYNPAFVGSMPLTMRYQQPYYTKYNKGDHDKYEKYYLEELRLKGKTHLNNVKSRMPHFKSYTSPNDTLDTILKKREMVESLKQKILTQSINLEGNNEQIEFINPSYRGENLDKRIERLEYLKKMDPSLNTYINKRKALEKNTSINQNLRTLLPEFQKMNAEKVNKEIENMHNSDENMYDHKEGFMFTKIDRPDTPNVKYTKYDPIEKVGFNKQPPKSQFPQIKTPGIVKYAVTRMINSGNNGGGSSYSRGGGDGGGSNYNYDQGQIITRRRRQYE